MTTTPISEIPTAPKFKRGDGAGNLHLHGPEPMSRLPPAVIPSPESVAEKLIRALQHGDVAVVLTRPRLDALITMCEKAWTTQHDFDLLQELKNLKDQTR